MQIVKYPQVVKVHFAANWAAPQDTNVVASLGKALYTQEYIMIFRYSVISCILVFSFYLLGWVIPKNTNNAEEIVIGVIGVCLYGVASVLTYKALRAWRINIKQQNYESIYRSLEILPSVPIVLIWCFLLVAIIAIPFGKWQGKTLSLRSDTRCVHGVKHKGLSNNESTTYFNLCR